jgi:diguanylate cyclase (GGDEF)-like protein
MLFTNDMKEEIKKLQEEIEKLRSQFYIFYELTKAMRTTLRLEEIVYIILTGLTAHQGLAFNRAILFLADEESKKIRGFMGIGPMDSQEADDIWKSIENQKMNLYDLIKAYHRLKKDKKPKFWEFIQSLYFPLEKEGGLIYDILLEKNPLYIKEEKIYKFKNDPLVQSLNLKEFLVSSLWINNKPKGVILVDNYITKKPITDDDIKIFKMFIEQAQGAIENSQIFEDTLTKAHTDSLTELWNYGYFQYRLDEEIMKAYSKKHPLSILMIDLDDFKSFNDTYGHLEGDRVLKNISKIFKECCRKNDIVCRYGGEEFSMILPFTDKEEAYRLGERIRRWLEEKKVSSYRNLTISIGIASYPEDAQDKENLIKKADEALYCAKRKGKNQVITA